MTNGTKVDICIMLEEAVCYVGFLQFQIRVMICVRNLISSSSASDMVIGVVRRTQFFS